MGAEPQHEDEAEGDFRLPGEELEPRSAPRPRGVANGALLALLWLGALAPISLGLLLEPDARGHGTHEQLGLEPCGALERWGLPCPGCGVTTATALAARGKLVQALRVQPFGLALALVLPLAALWGLVQHARGRDLRRELAALRWRRWVALGVGGLLLAWVYRLAVALAS